MQDSPVHGKLVVVQRTHRHDAHCHPGQNVRPGASGEPDIASFVGVMSRNWASISGSIYTVNSHASLEDFF
jgi:hypothetical protein